MNEVQIINDLQTMTLKEITDLLCVRHNDAMRIVEKMIENHEFGTATKISYQLAKGNGATQTIETYSLNKRQSIAVSARLNTSLLMRIIDRWQELENKPLTIVDYARALVESHDRIQALEKDQEITNVAIKDLRSDVRWIEDRLEREIENKKLYGWSK
ncbi:Bacteriophage regulatory protein, Rha family [uncultured Caudovirales phage]|uniref:Bacteriophage regulatory protein, Rha family n=1 Tax=uncultured Caudovirales phage TaxID=2100421 RepID=A0A6J5LDH2_9CAUD|nr:Bacteriophage regulatory protein, Rha family [uncultured Caudovirales phage]